MMSDELKRCPFCGNGASVYRMRNGSYFCGCSLAKEAPEGYKINPEYIEVKSKRVQLLLQPSTVDAIKTLAKKKGLSMNEAIKCGREWRVTSDTCICGAGVIRDTKESAVTTWNRRAND